MLSIDQHAHVWSSGSVYMHLGLSLPYLFLGYECVLEDLAVWLLKIFSVFTLGKIEFSHREIRVEYPRGPSHGQKERKHL